MSARFDVGVRAVILAGVFLVAGASRVEAIVYSWHDDAGVLHLSSDPDDIPAALRDTVKKFESKTTERYPSANAPEEAAPSPSRAQEPLSAYERGLDRGLQMADQQVRLAAELARTFVEAAPQAQPTRMTLPVSRREAPAFTVGYVRSAYDRFGVIAPYPYGSPWFSFGCCSDFGLLRRRFVPHSHFFPGTFGPPRGLFFPFGHATQSNGFLFGHGFVAG